MPDASPARQKSIGFRQNRRGAANWRSVPLSAVSICGNVHVQKLDLLDDLIGAGEKCGRHIEADRPGGLEIDDQLKPRGLLHWQVGRVGALQDLVHIDCATAVQVRT